MSCRTQHTCCRTPSPARRRSEQSWPGMAWEAVTVEVRAVARAAVATAAAVRVGVRAAAMAAGAEAEVVKAAVM
eukprot:6864687-Prymnesium_polylepis.1